VQYRHFLSMAATQEEADALQACFNKVLEFVKALHDENASDTGLTDPHFQFSKKLIQFIKDQHINLTLTVPDSLLPAAATTPVNSDDESEGIDDHIGIINTPNLGLILNMLIHTFNGDASYPVDTFLKDVSRVCHRRRIKGLGKIEIAMGKLRDPALSTVRAMSIGDITSWKDFKSQMLELFADVTDLPTLSIEISKCKQMESESVTNFSVRLYNLLLKKANFSGSKDKESVRATLDNDAIAMLMIGVHNSEIASVVRRAYPKTFKDAVKIAKLEELASKTTTENIPTFFKNVKLAYEDQIQYIPYNYQQGFAPRHNEINYRQGITPRNDERHYYRRDYSPRNNDQNYQQGNSDPRYRDQTPIGVRNQKDNGGNFYSDESDSNDSQRGRSRGRENSRQRRRPPARSLSAEDRGGTYNCPYVVPCDCQACEHNFSVNFIFPDVQCFDCYNYGHVDRDCIHSKRGWENPPRDSEHNESDQKINKIVPPSRDDASSENHARFLPD
jgi:Retrotransposon gag protein